MFYYRHTSFAERNKFYHSSIISRDICHVKGILFYDVIQTSVGKKLGSRSKLFQRLC